MTRIIDVITGVQPRELIFSSRSAAERWLANYGVSQDYKDAHYRIVSDEPWCYVCDRPKHDCACVENGGNY